MARLLRTLVVSSLLGLAAASVASNDFYARDTSTLTGDSKCTTYMCVAAVVNGSTVQYTLSGTGKMTPGWMAMGFGSYMANAKMVIMWSNSDGSVTLSQRTAPGEQMPTLDASPPFLATLSESLSTASGDQSFVYTIPSDGNTKPPLIFAFGATNPGSSAKDATLIFHKDYGQFSLDLTKSLSASAATSVTAAPVASKSASSQSSSSSGSSTSSADTGGATDGIPLTPYQRLIVAHAIFCVIGFALLLPSGVLVARYLRTSTPAWYTGHWIAQFGIAGPVILIGVILGFKAAGSSGSSVLDNHKKTGIIIFALYLLQCFLGAFIHFVKAKNAARRPPQNYLHAILGLVVILLGMYQIRTGYHTEWPAYTGLASVPSGLNILWVIWCFALPLLYALGLALYLREQYRQEAASRLNRLQKHNTYDMSTADLRDGPNQYYE
ncbi:unnamed protein product [Mycena citricolor]|uniref:CBD9-like protein n=1 Tax=Mycena citricolor TaxID=2018698 RepID=A0AAD2Q1J1_9AGAR|nr:unnamed protein product [Mycena citricolor]